jgi:hypothetical protein
LDIDYKLLVKYGEQMKNLHTIIIPISYFSLYSRKDMYHGKSRYKNYVIYHGLFFDLESFSLFNYFELLNGTVVSNVKKLLLLSEQKNFRTLYENERQVYSDSIKNFITLRKNGFFPINETNDDDKDENELKKIGRTVENEHKNYKNRPINYNEEILINIISWCAARNIQIFFFTVPAYKTYINNLNATQLYGTVAYMEDLARRYDNVTYENFLFEYKNKREYFCDSNHLNVAGARAFSAQIHDILQERGLVD